jgi:predicted nucleotide-binding protein
MDLNTVKVRIEQAGYRITEEKRLNNGTGLQLSVDCGAIVCVYDSGKIVPQGKHSEEFRRLLEDSPANLVVNGSHVPNKVFVVYGHDRPARDQLEAMLRRWGLEPLILDQLPSEGQTIIEKLENHQKEVGFAVVLATPDDEGFRANHPDEKAYRARQNVVLELGMLLALLGRPRVAILLKQSEEMEKPSDIMGLIYISFKDDVSRDAGLVLAKEMQRQGYQIDLSKL